MKLVFASCMDAQQDSVQRVWRRIAEIKALDVLMLLGDQIYMDWGIGGDDWRAILAKRPDRLEDYAREMHRRYALQWDVDNFRHLVCGFAGRNDPARLLVTWDDHDYAWNNALGFDGGGPGFRHGVPEPVKQVSRRLFAQFETQLRQADCDAPYPPLPDDWSQPWPAGTRADLYWSGPLGGPTGPQGMLLDTRWHREARQAGHSILGVAQAAAAATAVRQAGQGLLIIAAGTPMAHDYLLSQQDWRDFHAGKPGQPYAEYPLLTGAAARPVLFLGGDVHKNVFSGRLPDGNGRPSRVVQLLSSGAAIGAIGWRRTAPRFGLVEVPARWQEGGRVAAQLWALGDDGWRTELDTMLPFDRDGWTEPLDNIAMGTVEAGADAEPLLALVSRMPAHGTPATAVHEFAELDTLYQRRAQPRGTPARAVEVQATANSTDITHRHLGPAAPDVNDTVDAMRPAFERARAARRAVVLYIHGFGKSFADSLAQAYALRAQFAVEPVLYSWEAGGEDSLVASVVGLGVALKSAESGAQALADVLTAFGGLASEYLDLTRVVLARSAGSVALHHALTTVTAPNFNGRLDAVDRIVLSAPLLKAGDFRSRQGLTWLRSPVVYTRNAQDRTLRAADWLDGFGPMLGLDEALPPARNTQVLDFTRADRVGALHDYLFLDISPQQQEINRRLLTAKTFDLQAAVTDGLVRHAGGGVFDVL